MSQKNVEIVQHMLDAFNRGDVAAVIAAFDESCELHEPPETPDTPTSGFRGHDGVREWMANLREVAAVQFEPTSFAASGGVIFSEWIARGHGHHSGVPVEWTHVCRASHTRRQDCSRTSLPRQGSGPRSRRAAGVAVACRCTV
jgi:ketosteroid isomerase-like protein